jgi:hypothetical protein
MLKRNEEIVLAPKETLSCTDLLKVHHDACVTFGIVLQRLNFYFYGFVGAAGSAADWLQEGKTRL